MWYLQVLLCINRDCIVTGSTCWLNLGIYNKVEDLGTRTPPRVRLGGILAPAWEVLIALGPKAHRVYSDPIRAGANRLSCLNALGMSIFIPRDAQIVQTSGLVLQ